MKCLLGFLITFFMVYVSAAQPLLQQSAYLQGYTGKMLPSLAVSIPISTSTSSIINQGGMVLAGCLFPDTMTSTTMTFSMSADGVHFFPVYNSSGAVSYTIAASRYVSFATSDLLGVQYLEIITGSTEAAARSLICSLKGI